MHMLFQEYLENTQKKQQQKKYHSKSALIYLKCKSPFIRHLPSSLLQSIVLLAPYEPHR